MRLEAGYYLFFKTSDDVFHKADTLSCFSGKTIVASVDLLYACESAFKSIFCVEFQMVIIGTVHVDL